jgi:hypothetical protein
LRCDDRNSLVQNRKPLLAHPLFALIAERSSDSSHGFQAMEQPERGSRRVVTDETPIERHLKRRSATRAWDHRFRGMIPRLPSNLAPRAGSKWILDKPPTQA